MFAVRAVIAGCICGSAPSLHERASSLFFVATTRAHTVGPLGCAIGLYSVPTVQLQMSYVSRMWKEVESLPFVRLVDNAFTQKKNIGGFVLITTYLVLNYFGDLIIIVPEALIVAADSGMRALAKLTG